MSKENIQLFDLSLNKGDTCLTYVLKRLGLEEDLCSYETLHDHFEDSSIVAETASDLIDSSEKTVGENSPGLRERSEMSFEKSEWVDS
jgi:hypothetical protein